jgi:enamine deaminase RidA (YjgF/YER057c/UK114 family)
MSEALPEAPVPQGRYVVARRHGDLIFTAGMTPRRNGILVSTGPVSATGPIEIYREAVVLAADNALAAAHGTLRAGETISAVLSLTVYIAAEAGFTAHSRLADFASAFLAGELGEAGVASRTAIGVTTLPGGAPVEIQLVAVARQS